LNVLANQQMLAFLNVILGPFVLILKLQVKSEPVVCLQEAFT